MQRIDLIFDIEREINGRAADVRLTARQERVAPLVGELERWMREQLKTLSKHDLVAKAMRYMSNDWPGFTAFLDDGRICLTNNASEREMRSICRGRKAWLFVGSDRGGERAAMTYTLLGTASLNDVDPLAWLTDVLTRIADLPQSKLDELLPWTWKALQQAEPMEMAA